MISRQAKEVVRQHKEQLAINSINDIYGDDIVELLDILPSAISETARVLFSNYLEAKELDIKASSMDTRLKALNLSAKFLRYIRGVSV